MKTFTIDELNHLSIHQTQEAAEHVPNAEHFSTLKNFTSLVSSWPGTRLIKIWNNIPGNTPVTKFKDRATAVTRIWKAVQSLGETYDLADRASAPVCEAIQIEEAEAARVPATEAAEKAAALEAESAGDIEEEGQTEVPAEQPEPHVGERTPDVTLVKPAATKKATRKKKAPTGEKAAKAPREESKTSQVIAMLKREGGTTLQDIMGAMGWQVHTCRAMLSAGGSLTKKHGLVVISEKVGDKRVYSIKG